MSHRPHVHVLQHVPYERLGYLETWLDEHDFRVSVTELFNGAKLPELDQIDALIVLGGPISANDEDVLPWLRSEKTFIAAAIAAQKPTLGICLGSQLIASALGAKISANPAQEIGWFEIEWFAQDVVDQLSPLKVFHWHGESFALPTGARWCARSAACDHQAFSYGDRTLGLQFHPEVLPQNVQWMVEFDGDEIIEAQFVQSAVQILAEPPVSYATVHRFLDGILQHLFASLLTVDPPDQIIKQLRRSWQRAWRNAGMLEPDSKMDWNTNFALRDELLLAYAQPQRAYHTLQHLSECIAHFESQVAQRAVDGHEQHQSACAHPGAVELALWFHDAVYEPKAHDNEAQSAAWAQRALQAAGAPESLITTVVELVMATCHHHQPQTPDAQLLVDIDLSILAADAVRFTEYEAQIRSEYAWVPLAVYQTKRAAVLRTFLQRDRIFSTARGHQQFEAQARANLRASILALEGSFFEEV
jgi:predicted metal-dependent HD superfamily phosphohydrolase/GMP synthase-like glutamine amidotransferase